MAEALLATLESEAESASGISFTAANVVDGLFAIARAIDRLAAVAESFAEAKRCGPETWRPAKPEPPF